jgi:hypothetical protein
LSLAFFLLIALVIVGVILVHNGSRRASEARASAQLENAIQQEIARIRPTGSPPAWMPPHVPWSVIAGIWTHRLVSAAAPSVYEGGHNPVASLNRFTWTARNEPPYIVSAALFSLRESRLITITLAPPEAFTNQWNRLLLERTDVQLSAGEAGLVESGLLGAFDALAQKRFGRTTMPSVLEIVHEFIDGSTEPFKQVVTLVKQQGYQLGLYAASAYSIPHLAACEDQVADFVSRWASFAKDEPEIQQRLLTESTLGIRSRISNS